MSFDRTAGLTYLVNKYAALATLVGMAATDTDAGYGPVLDEAFLAYGTTYTALATPFVADADVLGVRALLRYYALKHFEQRLAANLSFNVTGTSAAIGMLQSVELTQVRQLLAEAAMEVEAYGYVITGGSGWSSGLFNLDFLEVQPGPSV